MSGLCKCNLAEFIRLETAVYRQNVRLSRHMHTGRGHLRRRHTRPSNTTLAVAESVVLANRLMWAEQQVCLTTSTTTSIIITSCCSTVECHDRKAVQSEGHDRLLAGQLGLLHPVYMFFCKEGRTYTVRLTPERSGLACQSDFLHVTPGALSTWLVVQKIDAGRNIAQLLVLPVGSPAEIQLTYAL